MSDTKERNFCFVYKGESLKPTLFESLHFQNAEGMYCREDGMWYARISLSRNHGRRVVNIPNAIDEYNDMVAEKDKIHPTSIPQMPSIVTCFKTTGPTANNHILRRIKLDSQTNPTYWKWEHKTPSAFKEKTTGVAKPPKSKKQPMQTVDSTPITAGLEGLVRELNLNPNTLDMQGAYTIISRNYFSDHNTRLNNSGQFESMDREYLVNQLCRYFSKELEFVSKPFGVTSNGVNAKKIKDNPIGTIEALVTTNGGSADDYGFIHESQPIAHVAEDPNPLVSTEPNETISSYFRDMLPRWLQKTQVENVEIAVRDIVTALNGGSDGGTYRSTCIPSFLRPFINENLIKASDTASARPSRYVVNVKGMAAKLGIENTNAL
jgi:hypothetical protein